MTPHFCICPGDPILPGRRPIHKKTQKIFKKGLTFAPSGAILKTLKEGKPFNL